MKLLYSKFLNYQVSFRNKYLSKFYFINTGALRRGIMVDAARFMSLIKERSYTAEKTMPALFPYINQYAAINLLRTDPDFFLGHLDQFFANTDIREDLGDDYANLYAILNNKETSVEEKIGQIEAL